MSAVDWLLPVAAFVAGLVVASVAWWVIRHRVSRPDPPPTDPPSSLARVGAPSAPSDDRSARPPARDSRRSGTLRISQRVVLHLARQPRLVYGDVAPFDLTQAGISRALATSQPTLARVLQRLLDGDAILEMRTHVAGQSQRLKVYQLTALGESIARDLRNRTRPSGSAGARGVAPPAPTGDLYAPAQSVAGES